MTTIILYVIEINFGCKFLLESNCIKRKKKKHFYVEYNSIDYSTNFLYRSV